jgi:stress response protein SCP2
LVVADRNTATVVAEFAIDATQETAVVCGELYRRNGQWKFRAVGQGYASGLAGLATDSGISVGDAPPPFPGTATLDDGPVNLVKGARVRLVKRGAPALGHVTMGLGWDPARGRRSIDLDASVIAFDQAGRQLELVWFMRKVAFGGALRHGGDNLTGRGDGDDEQIFVDLAALPPQVAALVFTITSYRGQKFTEVANAFCRLVDSRSGAELVRYNLSESPPSSAVLMAALRRDPAGSWDMRAIGEFHDAKTVKKLVGPAAAHAV